MHPFQNHLRVHCAMNRHLTNQIKCVIYSLLLQELWTELIRHQLVSLQHFCSSNVAFSCTSKQFLTLHLDRRTRESNTHRKVSITFGSTSLLQYFFHCLESIGCARKHHSSNFVV